MMKKVSTVAFHKTEKKRKEKENAPTLLVKVHRKAMNYKLI